MRGRPMEGEDSRALREEIAALQRRIEALEAEVGAREIPCPRCGRSVPDATHCASCGALLHPPPPAPMRPAPTPPVPTPQPDENRAPAAPRPTPSVQPPEPLPPPAPPPPAQEPEPRPADERPSLERILGQRWAPRLGAILVFLGVVFFLGVAVQRGWIGPLGQLALAAGTGAALLGAGALLTARRGYGNYPQVLEATGACVLYVTAFVAHALPYYQAETRFTPLTGGALMALVSIGTVGLALRRDSRVIAGLGYTLAFATAALGHATLPGFTLAYVALLGTSLALLVARERWLVEGVAGTIATGAFFLLLTERSLAQGDPQPWLLAASALVPAAAFLWLALRPPSRKGSDGDTTPLLHAVLTIATYAWAVRATTAPLIDDPAGGALTLAWALAAVAHARLAATDEHGRSSATASGVVAVGLWLLGAQLAWRDATDGALLVTLTYALGAGLAGAVRRTGATWGSLALLGATAANAIVMQRLLALPTGDGIAFGPWQAWLTLLAYLAAAAPLLTHPHAASKPQTRAAVALAIIFLSAWAFALGLTTITITLVLLALAASWFGAAIAVPSLRAHDATGAAILVIVAATQSAVTTRLGGDHLLQGALVAAALVGAFALTRAREDRTLGRLILLALIAWPITYWSQIANGAFYASATYALGAIALALLERAQRSAGPSAWTASLALSTAAIVNAVLLQGALRPPWEATAAPFGSWEAWTTFALLTTALALTLLRSTAAARPLRTAALTLLVVFLAIWTFALLHEPFSATAWLVALGGLLAAGAGWLNARDDDLAYPALLGALAVLALAATKATIIDTRIEDVRLDLGWAVAQAVLVAGALLGAFHLARARGLLPNTTTAPAAWGLVGGSALVMASLIVTYAEGAWTSLLLGALGASYLAAGFVAAADPVHRYTGFAVLGIVIIRIFLLDLRGTDLAIRALVFAALGALLLTIGYAYARASKKETMPAADAEAPKP